MKKNIVMKPVHVEENLRISKSTPRIEYKPCITRIDLPLTNNGPRVNRPAKGLLIQRVNVPSKVLVVVDIGPRRR